MGKVSSELFFGLACLILKVDQFEVFMKERFGEVQLIENVNSFFRYKVPDGLKTSQLFGELERNQQKLFLAQYSVKQATIEQIFINFANQRNVKGEE